MQLDPRELMTKDVDELRKLIHTRKEGKDRRESKPGRWPASVCAGG